MTSMKDIADRLNLSKGTVSLVLSGKAGTRISKETQERIREVAKELNYQVNDLARSLRTGQTYTIGVIVTDISNEYFGKMVFYIQEQAKKNGYMVLTANSNENSDELKNIVSLLIQKKVDGIIVVPTDKANDALNMITDHHIPMVQLDRICPTIAADYVGVNNYSASQEGVKKLVENGCHNIARVSYDLKLNAILERCHGYQDILKEHGLYKDDLVFDINFNNEEEMVNHAMQSLFGSSKTPDGVFFTSRRVFTTSMHSIYSQGFQIPESSILLCFDDVSSYQIINANIDYIEQPIQQMAEKSFDLLMEKIAGGEGIGNYVFPARYVAKKK